jgi:hypothetical protein
MEKAEFIEAKVAEVQLAMVESIRQGLSDAFDAGVAAGSVVEGTFTQEQVDAAVLAAVAAADQRIAELEAKVAELEGRVDVTPFAQADVDQAVESATAALKVTIADLETQLSQKDADALEEAIADELAALAQKLRDRTV